MGFFYGIRGFQIEEEVVVQTILMEISAIAAILAILDILSLIEYRSSLATWKQECMDRSQLLI